MAEMKVTGQQGPTPSREPKGKQKTPENLQHLADDVQHAASRVLKVISN